jgi:hypothetical protein
MLNVQRGSPQENGTASFNSLLRDKFPNDKIFYSLKEDRVLAEYWRVQCNTMRSRSSLGYPPPAPETSVHEKKQGRRKGQRSPRFPTCCLDRKIPEKGRKEYGGEA